MVMTADDVDRDKRELRRVGKRIATLEALYERRIVLYKRLSTAGLTHGEIGALAGTTATAVGVAMFKDRERKTKSRAARKGKP